MSVCVLSCDCTCLGTGVAVKGEFVEVGFLLLLCGFQGSHSGAQADGRRAHLPAEPSGQPTCPASQLISKYSCSLKR